MSQHKQQRGCFPADCVSPSGTGCPGRKPKPGAPRFAGPWLLLIPAACCGGPLLIAGLAAVGALAWGELGLAVAAVLAGALLAIRRYRPARAGSDASDKSQKP